MVSRSAALAAVAVIAAAAVLAACGSTAPADVKAPSYAELKAGLRGSPPELAALHSQMGKVIPGGLDSFKAALHSVARPCLRCGNYPVIVNIWASWCGPCRYEFPVLGQASLQLGKSIGFIGVANRDSASAAQAFLDGHPVGYPSWNDSDGKISQYLGIANGLPVTIFFSPGGQKEYVHQGPYESVEALKRDIIRYLSV